MASSSILGNADNAPQRCCIHCRNQQTQLLGTSYTTSCAFSSTIRADQRGGVYPSGAVIGTTIECCPKRMQIFGVGLGPKSHGDGHQPEAPGWARVEYMGVNRLGELHQQRCLGFHAVLLRPPMLQCVGCTSPRKLQIAWQMHVVLSHTVVRKSPVHVACCQRQKHPAASICCGTGISKQNL